VNEHKDEFILSDQFSHNADMSPMITFAIGPFRYSNNGCKHPKILDLVVVQKDSSKLSLIPLDVKHVDATDWTPESSFQSNLPIQQSLSNDIRIVTAIKKYTFRNVTRYMIEVNNTLYRTPVLTENSLGPYYEQLIERKKAFKVTFNKIFVNKSYRYVPYLIDS